MDNDPSGQYHIIQGNGADMRVLRDDEADLIMTSPPYFSTETELLLKKPRREQTQVELVQRQLIQFALSLRPVFVESIRILKNGGAFVLQTRDIRYGGFLLNLMGIHREMCESAGLHLITQVNWESTFKSPRRVPSGRKAARVGGFCARDTQAFLVFSRPGAILLREDKVELEDEIIKSSLTPYWRGLAPGGGKLHPYQSPTEPIRRFVAFYTSPGDLVVDPFAGAGTTLKVSTDMGRRAVGYELLQEYVGKADKRLTREAVSKNEDR